MKKVYNSFLAEEKVKKLNSFGLDVQKISSQNGNIVSDDLYNILPWEVYINEDKCHIILSSDVIDSVDTYIVSYDRISDNYICISFIGETMCDALFEAVEHFHNNKQIDEQYYV